MNASKSKLSLSFWLAIAALVVGAWPLFSNLKQVLELEDAFGQAFSYWGLGVSSVQYKVFVLLPFFEPLVLIWAVVANAVGAKRALRAAPSLTFLAGVFMFLLLNLGSTQQYGMQPVYALIWTLGDLPESIFYTLAILLSLAAAIAALVKKGVSAPVAGQRSTASRQPVAFDTATGQPIYGYDTTTGAPIY